MNTCLVTGGAGFIGCGISTVLANQFDKLIVIDNLHPQVHSSAVRPVALDSRVELIVGDITQPSVWKQVLSTMKPDVIIHLAAETGTAQSLTESSRHANVNVLGTTQMLDSLAAYKCIPKRVILTSSRAVYGEGAWIDEKGTIKYPGQRSKAQLEAKIWDFPELNSLPFEAIQTQTLPTSVYGATKLAQEIILKAWAHSFGVEIGVLRLQNVYGPGQSLTNSYTGIVSLFARIAKAGEAIPLYEDGEMTRDFVFIDDVVDAVLEITSSPILSTVAYDVGSGKSITLRELADIIADLYDAPEPVVNGAFRNGDVRHASSNIDRTKLELNWAPKWSTEEGVRALCEWINTQPLTRL